MIETKKIEIKKIILWGMLLLLPFFEPRCIDDLIQIRFYPDFFEIIGKLYLVGRILAAGYGYLMFLNNKNVKIHRDKVFFLILICLIGVVISNIINGMKLTLILSNFYDIGFLFLCYHLIYKKFSDFVDSVFLLFSILSILGTLSIFILPHGFNKTPDKHLSIYFLGSKNAAASVFLVMLFLWIAKNYLEYQRISKWIFLAEIIFFITGIITESSGTVVSMLLVIICSVYYFFCKETKLLLPSYIIVGILLILLAIYLGNYSNNLKHILEIMGRDATFTGRDVLWKQAVDAYKGSPIWGKGADLKFYNRSGTLQFSAHSQFLDRMAKYGSVDLIMIISVIVCVANRLNRFSNRKLAVFFSLLLAAYFLRMGFDVYNFNYFIIIMLLLNYISFLSPKNSKMLSNYNT